MTTHTEEGDLGFQIAPMVDVVFVLLLFFMACAGLREGFLQIAPPAPPEHLPIRIDVPVIINIDQFGNVSVGGTNILIGPQDRELRQLHERLVSAPNDPVILQPSPEARHDRVVNVLDVFRAAHVVKLGFK